MFEEYKHIIGLSLFSGIGPLTAKLLLSAVGSAEGVFEESKSNLCKIEGFGQTSAELLVKERDAKLMRAEQELAFMERMGVRPIAYTDSEYSKRLFQFDSSPIVVYTKGSTNLNTLKVLSVVGTRKPTDEGRMICQEIVEDLARRHKGLLIVSGLAYGIDVVSHRAALQSGLDTVGVLAHGFHMLYPSQHRDVAAQMSRQGCLLTEYVSGTQPEAANFVSRNRIVAGLSDATLVIESAEKGGSLITARIANEIGRDVLAVPGGPKAEMSKGCNKLIKENVAHLVTGASDIEELLGWTSEEDRVPVQGSLFSEPMTKEEQLIYDQLILGEFTASALSVRTGMPVNKVNTLLLEMEFSGTVKAMPGNSYKLVK